MNCMDIIILLMYGYVLFNILQKDQYTEQIILTLFVYYLLNYRSEGLENQESETQETKSNIATNGVSNNGAEMREPDLTDQLNMGPYDGICLKTGNKEYWMKSPDNTTLIPDEELYSYLGSQGPVKMRLSDQASLVGPPIDGVKGSPEKKFMFANNKSSAACCPSTFSTSTGCVCTTENQRNFIASRGVPAKVEDKKDEI